MQELVTDIYDSMEPDTKGPYYADPTLRLIGVKFESTTHPDVVYVAELRKFVDSRREFVPLDRIEGKDFTLNGRRLIWVDGSQIRCRDYTPDASTKITPGIRSSALDPSWKTSTALSPSNLVSGRQVVETVTCPLGYRILKAYPTEDNLILILVCPDLFFQLQWRLMKPQQTDDVPDKPPRIRYLTF